MKTPDEIKKGLVEAVAEMFWATKDGDADDMRKACGIAHASMADALVYIRQLEAERDAAVKAIELHKACIDCKHSTIIPDGDGLWIDCPKRDGRCRGKDMWQWRGVQNEE